MSEGRACDLLLGASSECQASNVSGRLLDVGDYTDAPLPHGRNLVAALVRLERSRSGEDAVAVLGALDAW